MGKIIIGSLLKEKIIKDSSLFQNKVPILTYFRRSYTNDSGKITEFGSGFILNFVYEELLSEDIANKHSYKKVNISQDLTCTVIPPDDCHFDGMFIDIIDGKISIIN